MSYENEKMPGGFVIRMADGRYVSEILANRRPEDPVIYFKEDLNLAKTWKTEKAAWKAGERVREKAGECLVWEFRYDAEKAARVLVMRFSDVTPISVAEPRKENTARTAGGSC